MQIPQTNHNSQSPKKCTSKTRGNQSSNIRGTDAQETTETTETNTTTETEGSQEPNETGTTEGPVEETGEVQDPATTTGEQDNQNNQQTVTGKELILYFNSTKMVQDGITYNAPRRCKSKGSILCSHSCPCGP